MRTSASTICRSDPDQSCVYKAGTSNPAILGGNFFIPGAGGAGGAGALHGNGLSSAPAGPAGPAGTIGP